LKRHVESKATEVISVSFSNFSWRGAGNAEEDEYQGQ